MTSEEMRELAALYALGGLDGGDRSRFEALLRARDPDAIAALAAFETTLVGLSAESAEAPRPSVKAALMERIAAAEPAGASEAPAAPGRRRRALWPIVWAAAMAAGIAAAAVGLSVSASYERRLQALALEAADLQAAVARQRELLALVADPAAQVVALSGLPPAPSARARVIWKAPAGGLLVAAGLPQLPADKTYQLWAIVGTNPPVSGGVFTVDAGGSASLRVPPLAGVGKVDIFAVTLEPAGGRPAPSGQMYLAGKS